MTTKDCGHTEPTQTSGRTYSHCGGCRTGRTRPVQVVTTRQMYARANAADNRASGLCPDCGSLCYGDCRSSR